MLGYVTVGTNDMDRAAAFYDAVLGALGAKRVSEGERTIAWTDQPGTPALTLVKPFDKNPATVGNGMMVALDAGTPETVDAVHAKAMEMGGKDEGAPGPRGAGGFYGGYFRDLDGNKLVAFCRRKIK